MKEKEYSFTITIMSEADSSSKGNQKKIEVELSGRDKIQWSEENGRQQLCAIACHELNDLIKKYLKAFPLQTNKVSSWELPQGNTHSEILLRELILRSQGNWHFPYQDVELCHCRSVPAQTVDQAIIAGAHTPEMVSRQTSASTACGTCRPDVEKILAYRLMPKKT